MSAKKKSKSELVSRIDRGTVAGGLAASLIFVAWAFVHIGMEVGASQGEAPTHLKVPPTTQSQVHPAAPSVAEPAYKQKIRDAITLGKEGLDDYKKALDWNENVGGDPFKFANLVKESGAKVNRSVAALQSLRKDAKSDSAAVKNIDQWVEYFKKRSPSHRK
ncbi:MAG: hypothetical protein MK209_01490 [Planctomycetes bacterium]|nr:hypothetical protein [Planctomycetota bacterium]